MLSLLLSLFISASSANTAISNQAPKNTPLSKMTLEQKVGQMFIFGFKGKTLTPQLKWILRELKPGSLIIFGRNIKTLDQISKLNNDLQAYSQRYAKKPLFLAIDQEGGAVLRIKTTPAMPSAYTIGSTNNPDLALQAGQVTGDMLKILGFNMNLAPVLDVTDVRLTSFISTRSFSPSPHKIGAMAIAFARGLIKGNVLPVAKHFPGHGPIALDSHHVIPSRKIALPELLGADLIPFVEFSNSHIDSGTMVAHIAFPLIDSSGLPATYSPVLIDGVLRKQMKYNGLIMTDDIEMAGAATYKKLGDRAVAAVKAGHDQIMVGWSAKHQYQAVKAVIKAVKQGVISEARINTSVNRILSLKDKYARVNTRSPASKMSLKTKFKKIEYKPVFNKIISHYFEKLPDLKNYIHQFKSVMVISRTKKFRLSFKKNYKRLKTYFRYSIAKRKKFKPKRLYIYHISSLRSYRELLSLPQSVKNNLVVINSHQKAQIQDPSAFLEVINIHSRHPNLGGFMGNALESAHSSQLRASVPLEL